MKILILIKFMTASLRFMTARSTCKKDKCKRLSGHHAILCMLHRRQKLPRMLQEKREKMLFQTVKQMSKKRSSHISMMEEKAEGLKM